MAPFPATKWTLILTAGSRSSGAADDALSELCVAYWYPAYAFVRRRGYSPDDALDLTQEFFSRFLEKRPFADADPRKGRFRSFLLTCIKRFLADQTDQRNAVKRGGGARSIPLEIDGAEERYSWRLADQQTPERLFEREWALTLIARVNEQVRAAFVREGRAEYFDRLKPFLPGNESGSPLSQIAEELGMSESGLKVAIHRLRRRYREVFRSEISELVSDASEIHDEVQHLLQILRA